jgi:hypothetical protein
MSSDISFIISSVYGRLGAVILVILLRQFRTNSAKSLSRCLISCGFTKESMDGRIESSTDLEGVEFTVDK